MKTSEAFRTSWVLIRKRFFDEKSVLKASKARSAKCQVSQIVQKRHVEEVPAKAFGKKSALEM